MGVPEGKVRTMWVVPIRVKWSRLFSGIAVPIKITVPIEINIYWV
jgi:hypothetical protein